MAIYATPLVSPGHERAERCGVDIQVVTGPPRDRDPGDVGFVFWAMQVSFIDDRGSIVAGGHFGLQWFAAGAATRYGVVNWGVYDDVIGGGAVLRGSVPTDPRFVDIGVGPSWGFDYEYGDRVRFRCQRSPRQDWTAAELDRGDGQRRPYLRSDQRPDETAWRVTIENLADGAPPAVFRDVLVKRSAPGAALAHPILWTECSHPVLDQGPVVRFANLVWDEPARVEGVRVGYADGTERTDCSIEPAGVIRQAGSCRREAPAGTDLRW
jgi:hypothetical protein